SMSDAARDAWKCEWLRLGHQRRVQRLRGRTTEHGARAARDVPADDGRRLEGRRADEHRSSGRRPQEGDLPVRRRHLIEHAGADIESAETPDTVTHEGTQDGPVVQHRVMREAEQPGWPRELGVQRTERPDVAAVETVEVPPPRAIRDELHRVARDPERL